MSRRIAFFDFDGTVTCKDTLLQVIKYRFGKLRFYLGFLLNSPYLVAYKVGIISNQLAKEKVMRYFFRKMPLEQFQGFCDDFASQEIPLLVRPKAMREIRELQSVGAQVVIVSASAENWLKEWCREMGVQLIATRLETRQNQLTGKISGHNCHGEEKVRRIKEAYDLSGYEQIYCYGDTSGDKPMLSLATFRFYQPFR